MEKAAHERFMNLQTSSVDFVKASTNFDVNHYRCEWYIDPNVRYISGKITSRFIISENTGSIVFDIAHKLTVDSIWYQNQKISYQQDTTQQTVLINFPGSLPAGKVDSVSIFYQGVPDQLGLGSFTKHVTHDGYPVIWTLSEPYGARDWWPCKNGLNDKADSIDIIVTSPSAYRTSSNGILLNEAVVIDKRIMHYRHRYPIASYLVAVSVTNFVSFTDYVQLGTINLPIEHFVYPFAENYYRNAVFRVVRTMQLFHGVFGDYPFIKERYAQTQFRFGGGMEHQTNSFIVDIWEGLVAHELAHQWFGDKITCGSWQDIWLNEGFAVFLTNFNEENFYSYEQFMVTRKAQLKNIVSKPDGSVFVDDTTDVGRIFSGRLTYNKGGWLLHMLRWKLGDSAFFRGVRRYLNDPSVAYKYALSEDLKRNLETESQQDLTEFFKDWLYGQGFPSYQLQWTPMSNGWVRTILNQTSSHSSVSFFEMPVPLRFQKGIQEKTIVIDHRKNNQLDFNNIGFIPDTVFIDPDLRLISANNSAFKISESTSGPNTVTIFPNPVPGQFYINLRNFTENKVTVTLHNSLGQLIWSKSLSLVNGGDLVNVSSDKLSGGVYWLRIKGEGNLNVVKKILK